MDELHTVENMASRSAFMRLVTTKPDPTSLAHAMVRGPLAMFGTFAATIYAPDADEECLELLGQWGFGPALATYRAIPLRLNFPVTRAYLTGQPLFVPAHEVVARYPLIAVAQEELLREHPADPTEVTVVAMPLQYQGVAIGACTWWCTYRGPWSWHDYSYIDGIAAATSMWLQLGSYESALVAAGIAGSSGGSRTPLLTDRQLSVLGLIREGKSNDAIATALGYSVSTVKHDVQVLFTVLGCTKRRELARKAESVGLFTAGSDAAS